MGRVKQMWPIQNIGSRE